MLSLKLFQRKIIPINVSEIKTHLEPGGTLSKLFDKYEVRESQVDMLCDVAEAINNEKIIIAEAGTGVGKSLAYLIPAFKWVMNINDRIVISTGTINLQHQLIEKRYSTCEKNAQDRQKGSPCKRAGQLCMHEKIS